MKRNNLHYAFYFLAAFILWTLALLFVDVAPIGPGGSAVGFSTLNRFVHRFLGVRMSLYVLTDWLSLIHLALASFFAFLGLGQWIRRKSLLSVDRDVRVLGVFFAAVVAVYAFFEIVVINERPVLIDGVLEASYPSSTTVLVLSVTAGTLPLIKRRISNSALRQSLTFALNVLALGMVLLRLISGVHWFTDIIGGILLSAALSFFYRFFLKREAKGK